MWDIIETDFGGDETANFGPRKETGTALYQIDTVATVSCQNQDNTSLPVNAACVFGDLTSLAVEKTLILQASSTLSFDSEIEEMEWSPDGSLVVMGLTGGMLFILDAESTEIVFSLNLVPEERQVNGRSFKRILFSDSYLDEKFTADLVILTVDGQLTVLPDIQIFKQGGENIGDMITNSVKVASTKSQHSSVNDVVVTGDYIYTLGGGNSVLCLWSYRHGSIEPEDRVDSPCSEDAVLLTGKATSDGHYIFTVDSDRCLSLWDARMLVCVKTFNSVKVTDLCLLETNTSQNNSLRDMKLVIMTEPEDGECFLKVQTLPDWETVYNLQLSAPSKLAKCNTFQDALYISEFCANNEKPGTVTTLRFRCLNETDPKTRLYRILQKNKFEEAEKFANLFQLDIELVHTVKANYLIDQLSPWNCSKYEEEQVKDMINQLWSCLDTIVDDLHTAENCMRAALPTYSDTEKLLSYCKERLVKALASKDPAVREKQRALFSKLLEIQHRLTTFKLAYGEESFSGEKWEQFKRADLLQESLRWLDRGHFDTGFIIWTRHQSSWKSDVLSRDLIQKILSTIPHQTPPSNLLGYISTGLIPCVVREIPEALVDLVDLVIDKTKNMETMDKANWPKTAIQFAEYMHTRLHEASAVMIDDDTCMANDNANKTRLRSEVTLKPLMTLIIKLRQLDDVLHKYKCRLSLTQFLKETKETITFRMLDKVVALDLISQTLERQIRPYMKEHGLNQDQIFSKYIKDLLERYGQVTSFRGEVTWEAKAAAVIDCITDVEQKIVGVLEVMEWAPVPWSPGVEQLVQMGLKLKHIKVSKIKEQCERARVRKLMMKYGLKNVEVPQGPQAERLMYFMLTKDKEGCMEDALEVMKSCGVSLKVNLYGFRMRQLITADRLEDCMELLKGLPADLRVKIGNEIVTLAIVKLNHTVMLTPIENEIKREKRLYTEAAILIIKYLQTKTHDCADLEDLKNQEGILRNILALQVEFDKYLTLEEYDSEQFRMNLIYDFMKDFFEKKQIQGSDYAKVYRLARILDISHTTIQGQLAIKYANAGNIQTAVQICGELFESSPTEETAETLFEVVQAFLDLQAEVDTGDEDVDTGKLRLLPDVCYRLANQAVCICNPDKLCQYLELCKSCSLLLSVSQQCESGDSTLSAQWGECTELQVDKELFADLTLDVFQEDALLMSSTVALPLVSKYAVINPLFTSIKDGGIKSDGEEASPVQPMCNSVLPVVQHLRENSHTQLGFTFSLHMLFTLLQYMQQQDMGLPFASEAQKENIVQGWKCVQEMEKTSQAMMKDLVFTLVMKIFNSSRVDDHLAFTYLCNRPKREVMDLMMRLTKAAGQQYKKLKAIAGMGIALGQIFKEPSMISSCQLLETNAAWGYRLSKMKISFKDAILGPNSEKTKLLPVIAQNEAADTTLVREFCQSFKLDEDEGLLLYLDHLFVQPDDASLEIENNKASVISRAWEAISKIKNEDELVHRIKKIYYRTSAYDYETLEFALEVIKKSGDVGDIPVEKGLKLLEYLKVYTRHADPAEYEIEFKIGGEKKESQIFMASLPPESKIRLPVHPLLHGDPWKVITPELNKETVATWLLMAKLLNLSPDQICLTAVQNMVRVYTETFTSPDGGSDMSHWNWRPDQANSTLLQDAGQVLQSIKNCESSLACAKWMVTKLPLGSEKVLVLKQCVKLAELWHLSIPEESAKREKAKGAYLKFLSHWQKMASAQALCLNGLGEAELLQNTDKPSVLLQKLYEHPSITQLKWEAGSVKPDIHAAAVKIAEISSTCLDKVHSTLIGKWLQSGNKVQQDSDTTMTFSLENLKFTDTVQEKEDDEEMSFKRSVHLVEEENNEKNMMRLFEYALKPMEGGDTVCCIRALRCLLHLYDDDTMKKVCNKSLEDIRNLLHIMIYLASLEKLHIRHSVETFISCHKEGLVKGIWKNHSHEKTAVTLVSCLCLDYEIYDFQLWTSILQRLHSFGLMTQLEYVLLRLNNVPELWQIAAFPKMWYTVVSMPLLKVCSPLSKEQMDTCVHYFNVLLRCPVLKELDGDMLSKLYHKLEMPACSLGCLIICKSSSDSAIQSMVCEEGHHILDSTVCLLQNGLSHGISLKIQETVFKDMLHSERFEQILDTKFQKEFVAYCVRVKDIDGLLVFAIKHQRLNEAKTLVKVYTSAHSTVCMKVNQYIDEEEEEEDSTLALLKAYLKMQNLEEYSTML
ncbi:kinetochore-associated protein 1-like [Mercenaria mercenaria]|uniref:kinetochore-associated protein 1-like n=1 Tax=Mercenaria mercenaria TaxID=6596 RepID=UPI00234E635F|nr:kinetochore-associated protein 1-like [Mercenaria mercenaria]